MNLLVITSSFPASASDSAAAAGLFVKDFCLALAELGHALTVVTPEKYAPEKQPWPGLDVRWFPWSGGDRPLSTMKPYRPRDAFAMVSLFRSGLRALDQLAAEKTFDHVLAMWAVPSGLLAIALKRRRHISVSTWCLGSDIWTYGRYPIFKYIVRAVIRQSDHVFADGIGLAEEVTRLSGRECPFLPSSRRLNRHLIAPLTLATPRPNFLFIGRYHPVKGVDVLLEAMAQYHAAGHPGHLYLFGGGPSEAAIRDRAASEDLRDCVTLGGYADESTYVTYLHACDVFLIPSRMESIPVVLSDAAQMGIPLIATDVGDMGRVLREIRAGIVVPPEDPAALCNAMFEMARADRSRYSAAIETLAARFDVTHTARRWIETINN